MWAYTPFIRRPPLCTPLCKPCHVQLTRRQQPRSLRRSRPSRPRPSSSTSPSSTVAPPRSPSPRFSGWPGLICFSFIIFIYKNDLLHLSLLVFQHFTIQIYYFYIYLFICIFLDIYIQVCLSMYPLNLLSIYQSIYLGSWLRAPRINYSPSATLASGK